MRVDKPPIVLCVPVNEMHKHHTPDLMEFYAENRDKHNLVLHWELKRPMPVVMANAVQEAKDMGASHILFTEHDQWNYPLDGLDLLLDADKDVIGLMTYMRAYPYLPMCMKKLDPEVSFVTNEIHNLQSFYPQNVIEETDLITWAFTLVKIDVIHKMDAAGLFPWRWEIVPPDSYFCQYCEDLGIKRHVHAAFVLNHGDIPKEHVVFHRRACDAINAHEGRFHPEAKIKPQNEDDPHGVVPYVSEAEAAVQG